MYVTSIICYLVGSVDKLVIVDCLVSVSAQTVQSPNDGLDFVSTWTPVSSVCTSPSPPPSFLVYVWNVLFANV
jgi:hypothetical protein